MTRRAAHRRPRRRWVGWSTRSSVAVAGIVLVAAAVVVAVVLRAGSGNEASTRPRGSSPAAGSGLAATSAPPAPAAPGTATAAGAPGDDAPTPASQVQQQIDQVEATTPLRFEAGEATLTPEGQSGLDRIVAVLRAVPAVDVTVTGYVAPVTPPNPAKGQLISTQRAQLVADRLAAAGIDPQRLHAVGAGPTDPGASPEADRRVELTVR